MSKKKVLVVAIYSHPEYYPPTLNAVELLSAQYDSIFILHRNITGFDWQYPSNVELVAPGKLFPVREVEKAGMMTKIKWFLAFTRKFFQLIKKHKPDTVLIYDSLPVLSYRLLASYVRPPHTLWYHNHDVSDENYLRKWSLSWFAWKAEKWIFPRLAIFSLPSMERKVFFPMNRLGGRFFFIPNFPSRKIFGAILRKDTGKGNNNQFRLLYQGSIGPMHGLEEIIPLLNERIEGKDLFLVLKGFVCPEYLKGLQQLAERSGTSERMKFIPPSGYREVITNAVSCHIGIGIHKKNDIMNNTLGSASNKIYEYAASGLPVLIFDNAHFRESLQGKDWVFFTDTSKSSLIQSLKEIISNYTNLSAIAHHDFEDYLCFEKQFNPVIHFLGQPG